MKGRGKEKVRRKVSKERTWKIVHILVNYAHIGKVYTHGLIEYTYILTKYASKLYTHK